MEEKEPKNDAVNVSLFEFRHNLGLLLDTRYNPMGLQVSHIEKEYSFWFTNCQSVNLNTLETHERSWIGLFKNEILLKDRFFVSTKNGAQYVRSNPDKLAEDSKELFDFANYTELQRWKQKQQSEETKMDAGSQTDSRYPNVTIVQEAPHHLQSGELMPEMPLSPDAYENAQIDNYLGVSDSFRLSPPDPTCQNSSDSVSTVILDDGHGDLEKGHDGLKKQKSQRNKERVKMRWDVVPPPVVADDSKIVPEAMSNDGDVLENAHVDHLERHPSPVANSKRREASTRHYSDYYHYGTDVELQRFPDGQKLEEKELPLDDHMEESAGSSSASSSSATNSKRKLFSTSNDYEYRGIKSSRLHERQSSEGDFPLADYIEPGPQTFESTRNFFDYVEVTQDAQSDAPIGDVSNILPDHPPKLIHGSNLPTPINMDEKLLVQMTGLLKGIGREKKLEGSRPKRMKDMWMMFPLQDNGLGIYLSDRDGTPFYWHDNRWDPNVPTPVPKSHQRRPRSFQLPPNSLIYGEFAEVCVVSGKQNGFIEFNVIDIAALDGEILEGCFAHRTSICHAYLIKYQNQQRQPKMFVGMKSVRSLGGIATHNLLKLAYVRNGEFHVNRILRPNTSLRIAGIGLFQLCPATAYMSGTNGFVFSMKRRYILQAPNSSSIKSSLEEYMSAELSKIFYGWRIGIIIGTVVGDGTKQMHQHKHN